MFRQPSTMEQSTDRHVSPMDKSTPSQDCDICLLSSLERPLNESAYHPWTRFSRIRSSALAGRRCCSLIVDAVETWLRHADHRAHSAVYLGYGLLFDTMEIRLRQYYSREEYRNGRYTVNPLVDLRWQADSNYDAEDSTGPVCLFIFAPHNMRPQFADIESEYEFSRRYLPPGNTASLQAFRRLENWITTCVHSHTKCNASLPGYVPERVLEITKRGIVLREHLSECIRYACLSHCWGAGGVDFKLTTANLRAFQHEIELSILPKTFRHAVHICSRLQIPYLWIDALCIIQDDDDDWNRAVATMADIYENGYLTIAATASSNSNGGCFSGPKSTFKARKLNNSSLHVAEWHQGDRLVQLRNIRSLCYWPLMTRAWVFQERTVSSRVVHFTDTQLLWECHSMMKSESGDINLDWNHGDLEYFTNHYCKLPFKYPNPVTVNSWHGVVEDYSQLDLTFQKDRLPALAAVVKRMLRMRKSDTYIAGLWKSTLLRDLTWQSGTKGNKPRPPLQVPSWSWASVKGAVVYGSNKKLTWARSIDILYDLRGPFKSEHHDGASISLECHSCIGYMGLTRDCFCDIHFFEPEDNDLGMPPPEKRWTVKADYDYVTGSQPVQSGDAVVLAMIEWGRLDTIRWGGLVLRQVSQGNYERIGVCYMRSCKVGPSIPRKAKLRDNFEWRYYRSFVASLPVRLFRIV